MTTEGFSWHESDDSGIEDPLDAGESVSGDEQTDFAVDLDAELSEVDRRLDLITFYRRLLTHDFFDASEGSGAAEVTGQVRNFIRSKVAELIGMSKPPPAPVPVELPFTPEQLAALVLIADSTLKKHPDVVARHRAQEAEQQVQQAQSVRTAPPPVLPKPPPTVRKVASVRPVEAKPQPAPAKRPGAKPSAKPGKKMPEGSIKVGRRVYGPPKTVTSQDGKETLTYRPDMTPPARSTDPRAQPLPMPTPGQQEMMAVRDAEERLRAVEKSDSGILGRAVVLSHKQ